MLAETSQEAFWSGSFGDAYVERTRAGALGGRLNLFSKILSKTGAVESVLELGCNIGHNLDAIKALLPCDTAGIEINLKAGQEAARKSHRVFQESILNFDTGERFDLVFTYGVLIHIDPVRLNVVYDKMYEFSRRYVLLNEYFNPVPVEVGYRGHAGRLFKRDFAKELMSRHPLELVDYGFVWSGDPAFPLDDSNWFLFRKR